MSKTGQVLQSEIIGAVKMRVRLSGMPELRLGLNDKVLFENTGSMWCGVVVVGRGAGLSGIQAKCSFEMRGKRRGGVSDYWTDP